MRAKIPLGFVAPKRYIVLEIRGRLGANQLIANALRAIQELYGVLGASEIRLALKHYEKGRAIIETTNRDLPKVLAALAFALFKSRSNVQLKITGVHGTLKKSFQTLKRQDV